MTWASESRKTSNTLLFLRPDAPGGVVKDGDIDNRIKTLFDSLKIAKQRHELGQYSPCEPSRFQGYGYHQTSVILVRDSPNWF